jgi:hypothetical protein
MVVFSCTVYFCNLRPFRTEITLHLNQGKLFRTLEFNNRHLVNRTIRFDSTLLLPITTKKHELTVDGILSIHFILTDNYYPLQKI